jgi:outer membrane protein OmpA-like peptidoglycan-associated protein
LNVLEKHPEVEQLEVQGHTSSEGGPEYNLRLSEERARAVAKWLIDHGVDAKRLVVKGYGLTQPLVPDDSEENRQKNRRVQFRLLKSGNPTGSPP